MKKQFFRFFDYAIYGFQWFALYFFQGFTASTAIIVLYVGLYVITAAWLITIFGEERTVAFITNHPYEGGTPPVDYTQFSATTAGGSFIST